MVYYDSDEDGARDYVKAVDCFRQAATLGHGAAMFMLGECYVYGLGVKGNMAMAEQWYDAMSVAPDCGSSWCEDRLELHYSYYGGRNMDPDDDTATMAAYRVAAERGDAWAQCKLGRRYYHGLGVKPDQAESARWYCLAAESWRRRAEHGDADAQYKLGWCHHHGFGVAEDCAEKVKLYRLAAEQGHLLAQMDLANLYACGQEVAKNLEEAVKCSVWRRIKGMPRRKTTWAVSMRGGKE